MCELRKAGLQQINCESRFNNFNVMELSDLSVCVNFMAAGDLSC